MSVLRLRSRGKANAVLRGGRRVAEATSPTYAAASREPLVSTNYSDLVERVNGVSAKLSFSRRCVGQYRRGSRLARNGCPPIVTARRSHSVPTDSFGIGVIVKAPNTEYRLDQYRKCPRVLPPLLG
jgi:hypothetical protein